MTTVASFTNIRKKIQNNINLSNTVIKVAVAWLTSKELLGQLTEKSETGCKIDIIISDHEENKGLNYEKFLKHGGRISVLQSKSGRFLHDKFAIFDNKRLVAGSYNWTNSAEFYNHEFIIQSEDEQLLKQFNIRFDSLKKIVVNYDKQLLLSRANLNAETKEGEFIKLEDELEKKFFDTIKVADKLGAKINTSNITNYIQNYGAVGGASRLIRHGTDKLQSGLIKLWEIERLDISFESIILQDRFKVLFDNEILKNAQKRLDELKKR